MPIIQSLNSKANIKKNTNQDLPFAPQQPVIASYYATSTAGQTSIANLGFSIDQSNTDQFFLFVDGKLLRLGASNDYVFAAIALDNTSSAITFNQPLALGLNIQAFKMGLKKESEFLTDNRFTSVYEWADKSFQGWINQSTLMTPTTSAGTPAAGTFYSQIVGRASMPDLSQDLRTRMGIERMPTQFASLIQNEVGPNNEQVLGVLNDTFGQIRFVGRWSNTTDVSGNYISTVATNDYVEVVFYGTGLNLLSLLHVACDLRASVDGGSEGSDITVTGSNILNARNYAQNQVLPVVAGLTLGVHTVKIRLNDATSFLVQGFEILNESASLKINSGVGYIQGKKSTTSAQSVQSPSTTFESGTLGSRGGRVVVYQKADGTIAKAINPTGSQLNLTSADHSNEEMIRQFNIREFGAARADDISSLVGVSSDRAFTLDDGTTTLIVNDLAIDSSNAIKEGLVPAQTSTSFITLVFVGTGCDVFNALTTANTSTWTITVDGTAIVTNGASSTFTALTWTKLVSGLPYGTHTVKIQVGTTVGSAPRISDYRIYAPKKPSIPAGAIELADYNVMATYVANATATNENIGTGVLRKNNTREWFYQNTWSISAVDVINYVSAFETFTSTNGAYFEYTFFGTGFEFRGRANTAWSATNTISLQSLSTGGSLVTLNSTNFPGLTTSSYGGYTFTYASGNLSLATSSTLGSGMSLNGLTLGLYKVRVTTGTANNFSIDTIDVITPIHSAKSNLYGDLQNTLMVGSNALSDNRRTTPSKDVLPAQKAWAQAMGITSSPTTTSGTAVPMPDMSCTVKTSGGRLKLSFVGNFQVSATNLDAIMQLYLDGTAVGQIMDFTTSGVGVLGVVSLQWTGFASAGNHKVDVYWFTNGTATANSTRRVLTVEEL